MYKKTISLFLLAASMYGASQQFPLFIDYGSVEFDNHFYQEQFSPEYARFDPFNGAPELGTFFMYLKNVYNLHTVVETGTFKGNTTAFFATIYDTVHTVEISHDFFLEAEASLRQFPNAICHEGSSPAFLRNILPILADRPVVFYLDAHWYNDWPLLDELTEISKTHKNNCVIVIDDFKVPLRADVPYDTHCINGEFYDYSYSYIKSHIERIFKDYTIHYLIPKNVQSRAKFVAMPKNWAVKQ